MSLELAKDALDVGLFTDHWPALEAFYLGPAGLLYEELLPIGGGVRQHRLSLPGSVLKINDSREPLDHAPTGYARLTLASAAVPEPRSLVDPDGLPVDLVPVRSGVTAGVCVHVRVADPDAQDRFLAGALGARRVNGDYRIGTTAIRVVAGADQPPAGPMRAKGFRYLTIQVRDVRGVHARLVDLGVDAPQPPRRMGDVAMISFIRDPGGNWIELSQRASLTGPLPPD